MKTRNLFFLFLLLFAFGSPIHAQEFSLSASLVHLKKNPNDTVLIQRCLKYISRSGIDQETALNEYVSIYNSIQKSTNIPCKYEITSHIAGLYNNLGEYHKALKFGVEAEKLAIEANNNSNLSSIYCVIGNTYLGLQKPEKMIEYYQKGYDIAAKTNDLKQMAFGAGGLGNYYGSIGDYKQSIFWNIRSMNSFDSIEMGYAQVIIRSNIASNYRHSKNFREARKYISSAQPLLEKVDMNYAYIMYYSEKGLLDYAEQKYPDAIESYQQAIKFAKTNKAKHNLSELYQSLSEAYAQNGQSDRSLVALQQHILYKDSVFNEESNKQLLEVEERYKSEKKDSEIKLLQQSNKLNNSELKRKSILIWAFGISAVLGSGLLFLLWTSIRRKNKNHQILAQKNKEIEEKQQEILSSINYAKRIQFTLLASDYLLENNLKSHFVLFKPKDIVSGDFYWAIKTQTHFFLAVCDCTGHGVPGAFMSLLNINFLKEAITEKNLTAPGEIIDFVRQRLIENLNEEGYNDGMDGVLLVEELQTGALTYAGANRFPLLISNGEIVELPYDKMPVGKGIKTDSFVTHSLNYQSGDMLYLFTDGYADQFGGESGKKFKLKNLKLFLQQISSRDLKIQKSEIEDRFNSWKGDLEQLDDVCVFGIQL